MINVCYISHSHPFWLTLAEALPSAGYDVKMWIGNTGNEPFAYDNFPDASIYPFVSTHKGGTLQPDNVAHNAPEELYTSEEFIRLRDQVYKMMNRQDDFGKYRLLEREAIFYSLFAFFYSELKENSIDLCVASEAPHSPATFILYSLCAMVGIERVHFAPIRHTSVMLAQQGFTGDSVKVPRRGTRNLAPEKGLLSKYLEQLANEESNPSTPYYMKVHTAKDKGMIARPFYQFRSFAMEHDKGLISFLLYKYKRITKPCYTVKTNHFLQETESFNLLSKQKQKNVKRAQKKRLLQKYQAVSSEFMAHDNAPYVFVPLHYEPEKTTNPDGGKYYNTYDMLLALRSFVPVDIPIYVKEHPNQIQLHHMHGNRGRSRYFYDFCRQLPNVHLLAFSDSNKSFGEKADIVATTGGTAAVEAAAKGKKALVFGFPWFVGCPNIFHIDQVESFNSLMSEKQVGLDEVKAFFHRQIDSYGIRASCYEQMRAALSSSTGQAFDDDLGVSDILAVLGTITEQRYPG